MISYSVLALYLHYFVVLPKIRMNRKLLTDDFISSPQQLRVYAEYKKKCMNEGSSLLVYKIIFYGGPAVVLLIGVFIGVKLIIQ